MLFWAVDNPPPANYLLISGDRDFSNALHQLRMRRYNILLAQPQKASPALVAAAKSVWLWTSLISGAPPLTNTELKQLAVQVGISTHLNQSSNTFRESPHHSNQKFINMGKGSDVNSMGKQIRRNTYLPSSMPRTSNATVQYQWYPKSFNDSQDLSSAAPNSGIIPSSGVQPAPNISNPVSSSINVLNTPKQYQSSPTMPITPNVPPAPPKGPDYRNIDVKKALEIALKNQIVVMQNLGSLELYVRKNGKLWKCVNPLDGNPEDYSTEIWDKVHEFMSSSTGKSALSATQSRYKGYSSTVIV
ncbi:unnamed protein product [Cuscuta epithymum]|uniref:NYN domain-containing protein n=1 Tax=Cuscuta epithymum TaxID=186058 RepID=A0AAV0FEE3_9ASTE|nr:unnamed protein product [Cuscuta epithymum]